MVQGMAVTAFVALVERLTSPNVLLGKVIALVLVLVKKWQEMRKENK